SLGAMANFDRVLTAAACAAAAACSPVSTESADRFGASGQLVALSGADAGAANACTTCHGLRGEGDGGFAPRLAGLAAGYLERQLIAYADGRRAHEQMSYIAGKLTPHERRAVAAYYAALGERAAREPVATTPSARRLYHAGDAT